MKRYKTVDEFMAGQNTWKKELEALRKIMLSTEMEETVKWGGPAYTVNGKNIIGLGSFKSYVGLWLFQGGLLKDPKKKLMNAQEGVTKAMRQWRFANLDEIKKEKANIIKYTEEAIANQKAGKQIKPSKSKPVIIPEEMKKVFSKNAQLKKKYESLNLTNRRDFAEHVGTAKREETRQKRLEKVIDMINKGIGLNDKYKK